MRIELKTVYDEETNKRLAEIYVKHFLEKQNKEYKKMYFLSLIVLVSCILSGLVSESFVFPLVGLAYFVFVIIFIEVAKRKTLPKNFIKANVVGCPYLVTFGLYDEYFYEKFENDVMIQESSIRYEFLQKVVETRDCFVLLTQRSQLFFIPKYVMDNAEAYAFRMFCGSRFPHIYKLVEE